MSQYEHELFKAKKAWSDALFHTEGHEVDRVGKRIATETLSLLRSIYVEHKIHGRLKSFTKFVRQAGVLWYSEHAFRAKFNGKGLMQCIEQTFVLDSPYCIFNSVNTHLLIERMYEGFPTYKQQLIALYNTNEQVPTPPPIPSPNQVQPMQQTKIVGYDNAKQEVNAGFTLNINLAELATKAVQNYVNESGLLNDVQERIKFEAAKLNPTQIVINGVKVGEVSGRKHHMFEKIVKVAGLKKQVFVAGPAGTGKTTLAGQIAKALGLKFGHMSCTQGMSEAHLLGRMVADGSYIQSSFVDIYESGGVFLFDEIDAADANTLLVINSALANGHMSVPNRVSNPISDRHDNCIIICAANTFGRGSSEYAGRNILDEAFLDRFSMSKFYIDYDNELEKEICVEHPSLYDTLSKVRKNIVDHKLRRTLSTRVFADGAMFASTGEKVKDILDRFFTGWTPEEKTKALSNINLN